MTTLADQVAALERRVGDYETLLMGQTCTQCADLQARLEQAREMSRMGVRRYLAVVRHVGRTRTKIINLLSTLSTSNEDDWRTLVRVRDLLDSMTEPTRYECS